jgi:hypothetical protein
MALGLALGGFGAAQAAQPSTPRLADGHPDLNGTWENGGGIDFLQPQKLPGGSVCITGCTPAGAPATAPPAPAAPRMAPDRPKYRPELQAKVAEMNEQQVKFDPVLRCKPPGVPRIGPPDKIVQTAHEVVFLYEDVSGPFFRIVPLNAKAVRNDASPSYMGDALGHWEGDTLVVQTGNFNDETWLTDDGSFHSTRLRVTERLRRVGNVIEYNAVADDPTVLAEPWKLRVRKLQLSHEEMGEPAPCFDQDLVRMQDNTHHSNPR